MIELKIDSVDLRDIRWKLKSSTEEARKLLNRSLNATMKKTIKFAEDSVKANYTILQPAFKKGSNKYFNLKVSTATKRRLASLLTFSGKKIGVYSYNVNPLQPSPKTPPEYTKARVLSQGTYKPIYKNGNKSFVARFASGHIGVVVRKGKAKLPLETIYSPSIPQLVGSKKVFGEIQPQIQEQLHLEVDKKMKAYIKKLTKQRSSK